MDLTDKQKSALCKAAGLEGLWSLQTVEKVDEEAFRLVLEYGKSTDIQIIAVAILQGMDYRAKYSTMTPLHYAAKHGYAEWVELLVDIGAPVETLDSDKRSALYYAIENRKSIDSIIRLSKAAVRLAETESSVANNGLFLIP